MSLNISKVHALNYTPSVEVGDELVWRNEVEYQGETTVTYYKYNITSIEDESEKTLVNASMYSSEDNVNYIFVLNRTLGTLQDYSSDECSLYGDRIIIPGTKVGDYLEAFVDPFGFTVSSIKRGMGVKMERSGDRREIEFNEDGIQVRYSYEGTYYLNADKSERLLYSINEELYEYKSIPGYSVLLIIGFSIIGLVGLFLRLKIINKKSLKH